MIYIEQNIYKDLIKLKNENCGFILGKNKRINKMFKCKNISKKENSFKIGPIDVLKFIKKYFFKLLFSKTIIMIYHVHDYSPLLSKKDKKNMINNIIYMIIFNSKFFLYRKKNNIIESIDYVICKDIK